MRTREQMKQRAEEDYGEFRDEKDRVILELFGGKCFLCETTEGDFHLHHVEYNPEDSSYKRNSKAQWTRVLRLREATAHPERFRLLCGSCHRVVTTMGTYFLDRMSILKKIDPERLFPLVFLEYKNRAAGLDEGSVKNLDD